MLKPVGYLFTTVLIKLHSQLFRVGMDHWNQQTSGWARGVLLKRCNNQSLNVSVEMFHCWYWKYRVALQPGVSQIFHLRTIFMSVFQIWGQRSKLVGEGCKRSWVQLQVCLGQNVMAVSKCAIINNYPFLCSGCIANIAFALLLIGELVIWIKVRMSSLLWCISLYLHWAGILTFGSIWECLS